jgi:hypothetical protein
MKQTGKAERPEALAQFAKAATTREAKKAARPLTADENTSPIPTDNADKHVIAEALLNRGAEGEAPDPEAAGEDRLPDRIQAGAKS